MKRPPMMLPPEAQIPPDELIEQRMLANPANRRLPPQPVMPSQPATEPASRGDGVSGNTVLHQMMLANRANQERFQRPSGMMERIGQILQQLRGPEPAPAAARPPRERVF